MACTYQHCPSYDVPSTKNLVMGQNFDYHYWVLLIPLNYFHFNCDYFALQIFVSKSELINAMPEISFEILEL